MCRKHCVVGSKLEEKNFLNLNLDGQVQVRSVVGNLGN